MNFRLILLSCLFWLSVTAILAVGPSGEASTASLESEHVHTLFECPSNLFIDSGSFSASLHFSNDISFQINNYFISIPV